MHAHRVKTLREKDKQLREELINRKAATEDPMVIADRLATLQEELASCEDYYQAVQTAIEGIGRAAEAMSGNITPALSRNAGNLMDYISDGRYAELRTGSALAVSLADGSALTTPEEMLSGGTKDAAYLALRIALMMQIFDGELPPLLMDEALCQVDDSRMKRILALLCKLSESHPLKSNIYANNWSLV